MKPRFIARLALPLASSLAVLIAAPVVHAASGTWTNIGGGSWSGTGNWSGGIIADGAGFTASLSVNMTGNRNFTVDGAVASRTLGIVTFGDTDGSHSATMNATGGGTLTFDNGVSTAQLNSVSTSGTSNTLNNTLPLKLNSSLAIANACSNPLGVAGTITANSAGIKTLSNVGTGGGLVTLSGIIADGGGGTVEILQNSATSSMTLSGNNSYTGETKVNAGTLALSGTNTGTGPTTVTGGILTFLKRASLYNNTPASWIPTYITVVSGGTLGLGVGANGSGYFDVADINTFLDNSHMGTSTANTGLNTGAILGLDTSAGNFTYTSNLGNLSGGNVLNVAKLGNNTLTLSGTNSYTGTTTAVAGVLLPSTTAALPGYNSPGLVIFSGGTVGVDLGSWTTAQVNGLLANATKTSGAMGIDTTISGNLTQWTTFTPSNLGGLGLNKLGSNTLTLNRPNTFTGATTVSAGTLKLINANALSASSLIVSGGNVVANTAVNLASLNFAAGTSLGVAGGSLSMTGGTITRSNRTQYFPDTITSGISGSPAVSVASSAVGNDYVGGLQFAPTGAATQTLGNVLLNYNFALTAVDKAVLGLGGTTTGNTVGAVTALSGYTTVNKLDSGTWTVASSAVGTTDIFDGTLIASGTLFNSYSGLFMYGGTLVLDYTANNANKLTDGIKITLNGGTLQLDRSTGATGTHTEVVLSTTLGGGAVSITRGTGSTATLRMNAITRSAGATLNLGAAGIADTDTLNTSGILGPWATIAGTDFAMNSTGAGDGPITAYASYTDVPRLTPGAIADGSATNVRLIEGTGSAGAITLGAATTTINTLNQSASGGTAGATIDPAGQTLRTNAMLAGAGSGALTIGNGTNNGFLATATASGELIVSNYSSNPLTINSVITNNTGASRLTISGTGTTILTGTNNYSGNTLVSGGVLQADLVNGLSNNTYLQLDGGVLQTSGSFTRAASNTASGTNFQWVRTTGGGFAAKGGKLTVTIGNSAATEQTWATYNNATNGNTPLQGANILLGTLKFGSSSADSETEFQNNINLNGATRNIDVAAGVGGDSATISGVIRNTSTTVPSGIVKTGAGTLKLTGINTYDGPTVVNAGTLSLSNPNTNNNTSSIIIASGATLNLNFSDTDIVGKLIIGTTQLADGVYKAVGSSASGTELAQLTGTGTLTVDSGGSGLTGYALWASTNAPSTTPDQDQDADGVSNGVEYVLGGTIGTSDLGKLPKISTSGGNLLFTFERDQRSIDGSTTVVIEVGTDLATWPTTYTVPDTAEANDPGLTVVKGVPIGFDTVTLILPQSPDVRKSARLKAVVTP